MVTLSTRGLGIEARSGARQRFGAPLWKRGAYALAELCRAARRHPHCASRRSLWRWIWKREQEEGKGMGAVAARRERKGKGGLLAMSRQALGEASSNSWRGGLVKLNRIAALPTPAGARASRYVPRVLSSRAYFWTGSSERAARAATTHRRSRSAWSSTATAGATSMAGTSAVSVAPPRLEDLRADSDFSSRSASSPGDVGAVSACPWLGGRARRGAHLELAARAASPSPWRPWGAGAAPRGRIPRAGSTATTQRRRPLLA